MINARHDPAARAAAAARSPLSREDLAIAGGGEDLAGGKWLRVCGPHLRAVRNQHKRNRTGCPGISMGTTRMRRADGTYRRRSFFYVNLGKSSRKFCIESLGREEAWRRAVKLRADHEKRIAAINAEILAARQAGTAGKTFARTHVGEAAQRGVA